jgi:hypothetical protein
MLRLLAVIAFIVAIILFVVVAIGSPTDAGTIQEWGFVAVAAGLACFALEGVSIPRGPVA